MGCDVWFVKLGFMAQVSESDFRVWGLMIHDLGLGLIVRCLGVKKNKPSLKVHGSGFTIYRLRFMVKGSRCTG